MLTIKDFSTALYALSKAKGYALTVILTLGTLICLVGLYLGMFVNDLPYPDNQ